MGKNMKNTKSFIGALWGDYAKCDPYSADNYRPSVDAEMDDALIYNKNHKDLDIVTYIMGDNNYNLFKSKYPDSKCVKICEESSLHDTGRIWHNKLHILKCAMEDYNEIVYMDWDTAIDSPLPANFWESLGKKEAFQAPLYRYAHAKINWREDKWQNKFVPCGAFIYIRDKQIPQQLFDLDNRELNPKLPCAYLDEVFYAKWTDNLIGGWKGTKEYYERFEPIYCNIRKGAFQKEDAIFWHSSTTKQRAKRKE